MIGNPKWFSPRKYTGWGLSPNCWQGWAYILGFILPVAIVNSLAINETFKEFFTIGWTALLLIDLVQIMTKVKKDERQILHEAISDRNALWFMLTVLAVGIVYQAARKMVVDPIVLIALLGATVVKAVSHFYLRDK